jgi:PPOX class probable FMN-dependent enzyme
MVQARVRDRNNPPMKQTVLGDAPARCITSIEQLESIYGEPSSRSLLKEIDHISDHYRAFIEKAPFVAVATCGPEGLDCSPRGDPPGFVRVVDERTVAIPDRRGNNRVDTLRNLVRDPRISLLFLIPGVNETLRINGCAEISIDPDLCASFAINGKLPRSVLLVTVERIYFQCQKALVRSRLWNVEAQIPRSELPSTGSMLETLSNGAFDGAEYDRGYSEHLKKTIY